MNFILFFTVLKDPKINHSVHTLFYERQTGEPRRRKPILTPHTYLCSPG